MGTDTRTKQYNRNGCKRSTFKKSENDRKIRGKNEPLFVLEPNKGQYKSGLR